MRQNISISKQFKRELSPALSEWEKDKIFVLVDETTREILSFSHSEMAVANSLLNCFDIIIFCLIGFPSLKFNTKIRLFFLHKHKNT